MLQRFGDVLMAAVGVGGVKKAQAVIVSVEQKIRETFHSKSRLMRVMSHADGSGSHGEAAGLDAGVAERDRV